MKTNTTTGRVTAYGFACGYVETKTNGEQETEIWGESGRYHVRQHNSGIIGVRGRVFWNCFDTLAEARNVFNRQPGKLETRLAPKEYVCTYEARNERQEPYFVTGGYLPETVKVKAYSIKQAMRKASKLLHRYKLETRFPISCTVNAVTFTDDKLREAMRD